MKIAIIPCQYKIKNIKEVKEIMSRKKCKVCIFFEEGKKCYFCGSPKIIRFIRKILRGILPYFFVNFLFKRKLKSPKKGTIIHIGGE